MLKYWVRSKNSDMHVIPADTLYITIDKEAVRKSGMMMASDSIPDKMVVSLAGKRALYKGDLMMLEILSQCNWTRPVYVATTVGSENYMNLGDNFVQEGIANRITPFTTNKPGAKNFDTEKTYNNVMHRYKWGGLEKPGLYIDETTMRMCVTHRMLLTSLASHLISEGKRKEALEVMQKCEKSIPSYNVPVTYMYGGADMARVFALLGQKDKAKTYLDMVWKNANQYAEYYLALSQGRFMQSQTDFMRQLYIMQSVSQTTQMVDKKLASQRMTTIDNLYARYRQRGGAPVEP